MNDDPYRTPDPPQRYRIEEVDTYVSSAGKAVIWSAIGMMIVAINQLVQAIIHMGHWLFWVHISCAFVMLVVGIGVIVWARRNFRVPKR